MLFFIPKYTGNAVYFHTHQVAAQPEYSVPCHSEAKNNFKKTQLRYVNNFIQENRKINTFRSLTEDSRKINIIIISLNKPLLIYFIVKTVNMVLLNLYLYMLCYLIHKFHLPELRIILYT